MAENQVYYHNPNEDQMGIEARPSLMELIGAYPSAFVLDSALVRALDVQLHHVPHIVIAWPSDLSSAEKKIAALDAARVHIAENLKAEEASLLFWVAKTVSVQTKNGIDALVTDFVDGKTRLTEAQMRSAIAVLHNPEIIADGKLHELYRYAEEVSGKQVKSAKVSDPEFGLGSFGLAPGVVGPWAIREIPRVIFPRYLDEEDSTPSTRPLIDYAVSTRLSMLLDLNHAYTLPHMVSDEIGMSRPIFLSIADNSKPIV